MSRRVVITGAAGLVGGILRAGLSDRYDVLGLDVRRRRESGMRRVRMSRRRAVENAFRGADVVVDLAALPAVDTPWNDVRRNNLPATWTAFEAARRAGVRRVVFASSNNVTGGYERDEPYASVVAGRYAGLDPDALPRLTPADPVRPNGAYAVGKVCGEAAARYHSDAHGLSVVCLRIGTVLRDDRPHTKRHLATMLSHRDLVQLVERCIEAPDELRFGCYYGVSRNTWRIWDISDAEAQLGYRPDDDAERWRVLLPPQ